MAAQNGRGRLPVARRSDRPGRHVVRPGAGESAQVLGLGEPGGPLFSPSSARCRGADRLSGLQLVDRAAGEGATGFPSITTRRRRFGPGPQWRAKKMCRLATWPYAACRSRRRGCGTRLQGALSWAIRSSTKSAGCRWTSRLSPSSEPARPAGGDLAGSRTQEVSHNLKWFLEAAAMCGRRCPRRASPWRLSRNRQAEDGAGRNPPGAGKVPLSANMPWASRH